MYLIDILEKRDITVIKAGIGSSKPDFFGIDLVGYQADTLVCSDVFEKEIGGSSKLVSIARQAKLTKIIIIADDIKCDGIETEDYVIRVNPNFINRSHLDKDNKY